MKYRNGRLGDTPKIALPMSTLDVVVPLVKIPLAHIVMHTAAANSSTSGYTLLLADSITFMTNPTYSPALVDKLTVTYASALKLYLHSARGSSVALMAKTLLAKEACDSFWPTAMNIARFKTLEDASKCYDKKVKNLLSSETFIPCLLAAFVKTQCRPEDKFKRLIADVGNMGAFLEGEGVSCESFESVKCLRHDPKNDMEVAAGTIYLNDDESTVSKKVTKAYCQPQDTSTNPVLDHFRLLIFPYFGGDISVDNTSFSSFVALSEAFASNTIQPQALKQSLIIYLNKLLATARGSADLCSLLAELQILGQKTKRTDK